MITNEKVLVKPICADCTAIKSFFDKIEDKDDFEIYLSQFLIDRIL